VGTPRSEDFPISPHLPLPAEASERSQLAKRRRRALLGLLALLVPVLFVGWWVLRADAGSVPAALRDLLARATSAPREVAALSAAKLRAARMRQAPVADARAALPGRRVDEPDLRRDELGEASGQPPAGPAPAPSAAPAPGDRAPAAKPAPVASPSAPVVAETPSRGPGDAAPVEADPLPATNDGDDLLSDLSPDDFRGSLGTDANLDLQNLGAGSLTGGTTVDPGSGTARADAGIDAPLASADLGVGASIGPGSLGVGTDLGVGGTAAAVDLRAGGGDVGTNVGVAVGSAPLGATLGGGGVAVDLPAAGATVDGSGAAVDLSEVVGNTPPGAVGTVLPDGKLAVDLRLLGLH
jgi:hypothetical protein